MTRKRKTPYERLIEIGLHFAQDVLTRRTRHMMVLELRGGPLLVEIYHRAIAADQLGYEIILSANNGQITLSYRQKITQGEVPLEFLP